MSEPQEIALQQAVGRGKVILAKEFTFEASHVLPKHHGKCARLHGHSWKLTVYVDGFVDPDCGFVVDYYNLSQCVKKHIIDVVDHAHLGCFNMQYGGFGKPSIAEAVFGASFYPSSENLIQAFRRILEPLIPELAKPWQEVRLKALEINETCTSKCIWSRND